MNERHSNLSASLQASLAKRLADESRFTSAALNSPTPNLLEMFHARQLRSQIVLQLNRLQQQSCGIGWCNAAGEFEALYCDDQAVPQQNPLRADEVAAHYSDLLVALDYLLLQLGDEFLRD